MSDNVIVTIRCLVYNHEPYIRQCLEGFVMQKTNFTFEAIVHDDASIDGSAAIIKEYAEKYPDIIKPIYETENQYSKHDGSLRRIMDSHTRGKYIAYCEGDDYWIDPLKLQKQVDLLEGNPSASLCCGGYIQHQQGHEDVKQVLLCGTAKYFFFDLKDWINRWITMPLTVVCRRDFLNEYNAKSYHYSRDIHLIYHLLKEGKGIYLSESLAVYNIHVGGVCSMVSKNINAIHSYNCYKEIYQMNHDPIMRKPYLRAIIARLRYPYINYSSWDLFKEGMKLSSRISEKINLIFSLYLPTCFIEKYIQLKKTLL